MICDDVQASISAYADGELPPDEEGAMFAHIGTCPVCRKFLRSVLEIRSAVASAARPDVPGSLDRRVLTFRPGARPPKRERMRWFADLWMRRLSVPFPSAALVAIALLSITIFTLSLLMRPSEVPLLSLPPVDVYAEQPQAPAHTH